MKAPPTPPPPPRPAVGLRILCVHGVGRQETDPRFVDAWKQSILDGLRAAQAHAAASFSFVSYDALFAGAPRNFAVWRRAFDRLLASGFHALMDKQRRGGVRAAGVRGLGDWFQNLREGLQWTAGMVAQWAADDTLRAKARAAVNDAIRAFEPDVVVAHSLGSLICYDAFARPQSAGAKLIAGRVFVSFGSQINNPFVRDLFGGRIGPLPARQWFHLYNRHDDAFTAPIRLPLPAFTQVETDFDLAGFLDHDAGEYLRHPETARAVWRVLARHEELPLALKVAAVRAEPNHAVGARAPADLREAIAFSLGRRRRGVEKRALLVGINDYPRPEMRLEGCVNDVYLVSGLLQDQGFASDQVRIVLNSRATATAIRERLEWLLDGCADGQVRVFYYSGHGAQLPGYGHDETVDRADECLVPVDFDWTPERAVVDNWFYELYSQLPAEAHFLAVFDCCHSGGMARDGGARVRGLSPPDDVRHRVLAWEPSRGGWNSRPRVAAEGTARADRQGPAGEVRLRRMFWRASRQPRRTGLMASPGQFGHAGPFQPVLLQACREDQLAYEHRDGATPYGAFTWSLARALRGKVPPQTWGALRTRIETRLAQMAYDQAPGLEGPPDVASRKLPWLAIKTARGRDRAGR